MLWDWSVPYSPNADNHSLPALLGMDDSPGLRIAVYAALGAAFALTLPVAVRAMALLEAQLGPALLTLRAGTHAELGPRCCPHHARRGRHPDSGDPGGAARACPAGSPRRCSPTAG